jgi:hypothetical protein
MNLLFWRWIAMGMGLSCLKIYFISAGMSTGTVTKNSKIEIFYQGSLTFSVDILIVENENSIKNVY